jgi:hypothetical protein
VKNHMLRELYPPPPVTKATFPSRDLSCRNIPALFTAVEKAEFAINIDFVPHLAYHYIFICQFNVMHIFNSIYSLCSLYFIFNQYRYLT